MSKFFSFILNGAAVTTAFFVLDVILATVSVVFLVWLYVKTNQRAKKHLFSEKMKEVKKVDDDTYIIPSNNKNVSDGKKSENPLNHLANQISEFQEKSDVVEMKESTGSQNFNNEEKTLVAEKADSVVKKTSSKTASNNKKKMSKKNKTIGNYQNFSNLMDAIKDETALSDEKKNKKDESVKKISSKEKQKKR